MSYVGSPFEYDVFVSYGRANREGGDESPLRNWSLQFARELKTYLLGPRRFSAVQERTLRVFVDESDDGLHRLQELTAQIRGAAASSAILLILMSEDYLASDWCAQELEAWHIGQAAEGIAVNGRIAVVRIEPTNEDRWNKRLRDSRGVGLPGFWLHARPKNSRQVVLPFGHPVPDPKKKGPFQDPFLGLVSDLWNALGNLKDELDVRNEAQRRAERLGQPAPLLYLHARAGRLPDWTTFHALLSDGGFLVAPASVDPDLDDPDAELKLHKERLRTIKNCDALLALSTEDSAASDSDLIFISRWVRRELQAGNVPHMPCAVLNSVMQVARTATRRELANRLDVRWIDSIGSDWVPDVRSWLWDEGKKNEKLP